MLPEDAAGWRDLIASVPARILLRDINANKNYSRIIFQGFRGGVDVLKNPIVQGRIVELAQKNAVFGKLIALSARLNETVAEAQAELFSKEPTVEPECPASETAQPKLKERVKEQRATILQKEARIKELEVQLGALNREREASKAELEAERKARKEAESAFERERRQRERESRRAVKPETAPAPTTNKPVLVAAAPTPVSAPPIPAAFDEAMRRVLNRGKYAAAAEVCRELLAAEGLESGARGAVHGLFADALYGQGLDAEGEEQDRLAVGALLDAGQVLAATEALGRLLAHGPNVPLKAPELALLQRLLAVTQKRGLMDDVQKTLSRLRVTAPTGYARLRKALLDGKKHAPLLKALAESASAVCVTADETVALPVLGKTAATVTARRLLQAIESGDENFVTCARDGVETLRESNAALADALLEAVAALHPLAALPLTNPLPRPVVVDASNVARYNPDPLAAYLPAPPPASTGNLLAIRDFLWKRGYFPVLLVADANLRHHVDDKKAYIALVERGIVREVAGGTSADEKLLAEARGHVAPLVSNDRFSEFGDAVKRVERVAFEIFPGGIVVLNPL